MLQTNYDNFMSKVLHIYSMMYDIPINAIVWKESDLIAYFNSVIETAKRDPSDRKVALAADFSKAALNYLETGFGLKDNSAMGEFTNLNNLYRLNQKLGTTATLMLHNTQYGLVDHYLKVELTTSDSFITELAAIESIYEDLTYREGSDPANVKVQGILRQLLELRFAVSVHYFNTDQSKEIADVLNRIESIFSSLMDDTYSAGALYRRIIARTPS